jgi:predicted enzyme related to lactoylglutathione lyase
MEIHTMDTKPGRFVWHELLTTDTKAAIAFYTEVIGWKTMPFGEGADPYMMWASEQGPLGGVYPLPDQAKAMGAPPHWMGHVEVANVDETIAKAKGLGARVYVEPQDIPKVGRFAIIADPQGASISVFTPSENMGAHDTAKFGEFSWNELMTSDNAAALDFYTQVFGWEKTSEMDMGPMGKYLMFGQGGKSYGGMSGKPEGAPMPTAWLYYIHVEDLEGTIARATAKGAKLLNGPMDIPGDDRIAQLLDPQGAAFALHGRGAKKA